jgi:hypothetical protein
VSVELAIAGGRAFLACAQSGQGWVQNSIGGEFTGTEEPLLLVSGVREEGSIGGQGCGE